MSVISNENLLSSSILTSPYAKVISKLNEIKQNITSPNTSQNQFLNKAKILSDIDSILKDLNVYIELYKLDLSEEKIAPTKKDNQNHRKLKEQIDIYNKSIVDLNKELKSIILKSSQVEKELTTKTNSKSKKSPDKKIKKSANMLHAPITPITQISPFPFTKKLTLNSLKKVMRKEFDYSYNNINFINFNTNPNQSSPFTKNNQFISYNYQKKLDKIYKKNLSFNDSPNKINLIAPLNNKRKTNYSTHTHLTEPKANQLQKSKNISNINNSNNINNNNININDEEYSECLNINSIKSSLQYLKKKNYNISVILTKDFNIFELKSLIGHENVLPLMGSTVLNSFNLLSSSYDIEQKDQKDVIEIQNKPLINASKLEKFLYDVSNSYYKTVLYHNSIHGSDVCHTTTLYFLNSNAKEELSLTNIDLVSIFIAALGHDIGHPGLTNNFHINSRSEMAITYNDISCLENYHTSKLFKIILKNETSIFDILSVDDYKYVRKRMINMILATDMAIHKKVIEAIDTLISESNKLSSSQPKKENSKIISNLSSPEENKNSVQISKSQSLFNRIKEESDKNKKFDMQQKALDYFIHSADLAHNTKSFNLSLHWVELLSNESWMQGDKERELNLPVSPLCDRNKVDIPNSQIGFIKFVIIPTFSILLDMFPCLSYTVNSAKINLDNWTKLAGENRKRGWTPPKEENEGSKCNGMNHNNNNNNNDRYSLLDISNNMNNCIANSSSHSNNLHSSSTGYNNKKLNNAYWGNAKLLLINKSKSKDNNNKYLGGNNHKH